MYTVVDLDVTPYSSKEALESELKRLESLESDPGIVIAIEQVKQWLELKEND